MSTRSYIGIRNSDNTIKAIYSHWDGYVEHNGRILFENYKDKEKIESLLELGDISSLDKDIAPPEGVEHSFDNPAEGVVVAYHRDRGEDYSAPMEFKNDNALDKSMHDGWIEFCYLWDKTKETPEWTFRELKSKKFKSLATAMEKIYREEREESKE